MEFVWPSSDFAVLGDAGNGVITHEFLENDISKWGIEQNLPRWIPGLDVPITDLSIVDSTSSREALPVEPLRHLHDGLRRRPGRPDRLLQRDAQRLAVGALTWWEPSCEWNPVMREQNFEIRGARTRELPLLRRHRLAAHDVGERKVYTDTTGSVPTLLAWIARCSTARPTG